MGGLLVTEASEISAGSLILRVDDPVLGQRSLTPNLDPKTAQPGDLPNSCVDFVEVSDDDDVLNAPHVRVVFQDGTDLALDGSAHVEAVSR